jgi:hypothetical protein
LDNNKFEPLVLTAKSDLTPKIIELKNMPTVFNEYKDYKTAAQRHLMTCQYMVECLTLPDNSLHKPMSSSYKSYLLKNIYYLSGYTIESIINFAIYECVNKSKTAGEPKITYVNELWEPNYKLIFTTDKSKTPRPANDRTYYTYVISYHKFRENYKVLYGLANSYPNFDKIPVIGRRIIPVNWNTYLRQMFQCWEAQIRYTDEIPYTENQIVDFFKLSVDIYNGVRNHITN